MQAHQLSLFDRSILIVGPGNHFGEETALRFAKEGYVIGLISRSDNSLSQTCQRLADAGAHAFYRTADVSDRIQLSSAIQSIAEILPNMVGVIYNVKDSVRGNGYEIDPSKLVASFSVNVVGAMNTIQLSLPFLRKTLANTLCYRVKPSIILTGGGYKDKPDPNKLPLQLAKTGIHAIYTSLNRLNSRKDILVKTLVIDGYVAKEGNRAINPEAVAEALWQTFISDKPNLYETVSFLSSARQMCINSLDSLGLASQS